MKIPRSNFKSFRGMNWLNTVGYKAAQPSLYSSYLMSRSFCTKTEAPQVDLKQAMKSQLAGENKMINYQSTDELTEGNSRSSHLFLTVV